jgi:hypothetical protein
MLRAFGIQKEIDVPPDRMEAIFDRGRRFHESIESMLVGHVGPGDLEGDNREHLTRIQNYIERFHIVEVLALELPVQALTSAGYVVRGRIDAILRIDGVITIVDWKRAALSVSDALQMAGYQWLAQAEGIDFDDGVLVSAAGDGPVEARRPTASAVLTWQTMLRLYGSQDRGIEGWATVIR